MRFKIKSKKEFRVLTKHINDGTSYNVSIAEVSLMSGGFTDEQRLELAKIMAETIAITVPPLIEKALTEALKPIKQDIVEIKDRLSNLEKDVAVLKQDMIEVKKDIAEIKSLPTIQRELKQKRSN